LLALLLLCGTIIAARRYPLGEGWLLLALTLYAAVLWRHPALCLPAALTLLPLLNLSPWTGWILLGEADFFIAVTVVVYLLRPRTVNASFPLPGHAKWIMALVAGSFFVSALVGLLPLPRFDDNALVSYYSGFNSLRELKGLGWGLGLLPLVIEAASEPPRMQRRFVAGLLAGLVCVVAVIIWERLAFAGLFDFAGEYRVEGTFPELHTGGGDLHAYLVTAIPFVVAWIVMRPSIARVASGTVLFMLASYAIAVTFTRGGYVGYGGAIGVLGVAAVIRWLRQRSWQLSRVAIAALLVFGGLAVMIPIVSGSFMEVRLAQAQTESATRIRHWVRAIELMDPGVTTALLGMGLGSFPRTVLIKDRAAASATFSYEHESSNSFLRLGSGKPLYLDQRVSLDPEKKYTLSLDLRSSQPNAVLYVPLCEKSSHYSFRCKWTSLPIGAPGRWERHEIGVDSGQVGSGPWFLRRPVALSLTNSQPGTLIDVDNVQLLDERGYDLVANGSFSMGGAHWFFSADDHLPWHIFNLWVQIFFEQGWVGVLVLGLAVLAVLGRLATAMWRGDLFFSILLAALCGYLLVGVTESLFDGPRVTTRFFLLLFVGLLCPSGLHQPALTSARSRLRIPISSLGENP